MDGFVLALLSQIRAEIGTKTRGNESRDGIRRLMLDINERYLHWLLHDIMLRRCGKPRLVTDTTEVLRCP